MGETLAERPYNAVRLARHLLELEGQVVYLLADWQRLKRRLWRDILSSFDREPRLAPERELEWLRSNADSARRLPPHRELIEELPGDRFTAYRLFSNYAHAGYANVALAAHPSSDSEDRREGREAVTAALHYLLLVMALGETTYSYLAIIRATATTLGNTEEHQEALAAACGRDVIAELAAAEVSLASLAAHSSGLLDEVTAIIEDSSRR